MKKTLLPFILMLFSSLSYAQKTVKGSVTDSQTGEALIGAAIQEKGTNKGTVTDISGNFSMEVSGAGTILVFSFIGYQKKEVTVQEATNYDITLTESGISLGEVLVVGSRNPNRVATETVVPVDVINIDELRAAAPQVNLNQMLNYVAPSFTSNVQNISDGTDHIDPASLRGLGPDQVLVLVNGKRRHTTSLVNVNGTFGRGNVGTDLNAIPAAAIKRIEVLRDGAAAQYGSDAIAGVINIVLKDDTDALNLSVTTGANFSKNANVQTGGTDGVTTNVAANFGLKLGDRGGRLNFSGDFDVRDPYNRMKEFEGNIFNLYNRVERVAAADGYDITNLLDDDVADVIQYAEMADIDIQGAATKDSLQTILIGDDTESELTARGQTRADYNMRIGQSALRGGRFFANLSLPLDEEGTEFYAFGGISTRVGNSAGFYRLPSQSRTFTPAYINGFLPEINSDIRDQSVALGIKGKVNNWDVDFSNTYGRNAFLYTIGNTFNASLQNASPLTFDAGGFSFSQNTSNLDINRFFSYAMQGLNVAFGAEYRVERYEIVAGEEPSYSQYTPNGQRITLASQNPAVDFFGRARPGGSQVFPGFSPANELSRDRSSIAAYLDLEADVTKSFLLNLASRYENYSDFGSTINFKLATRVKAGDRINIRAAANTGFRAPSLHQINFNSTSTIFDQDGIPQEVGTFANESRAATLLGIPKLKQETSQSVSLGANIDVAQANITISVDAYLVRINDRVVYTGQFTGPGTGSELDNLLRQANASRASFFVNAIDTRSQGIDVVITHKANLGTKSLLTNSLAATFSQTRQNGDINASDILRTAGLVSTYFPEDSRVYLEEAVPRTKVNLTNTLSLSKWVVFLRNVYFGSVTEATTNTDRQQVFGSKIVTDLSVGYKIIDALSLTIGANNLLDVYPDRATLEFSDGGTNRSSGRFDWSRRSQQFGIGGRFLFARLTANF